MRLCLLFSLAITLFACSRQPLFPDQQKNFDHVSAAAFLGNEFVVDLSSRSLLRSRETILNSSSWQLDAAFRDLFQAGVRVRGREFRAFELDQKALEKALGTRESRWKKTSGKQSHALMEQLFLAAEGQGIRYFFLLTPLPEHELFPLHQGTAGAYCHDRDAKDARAYVYFLFDFTFWDVRGHGKVFEMEVNPGATESMTFADCGVVF